MKKSKVIHRIKMPKKWMKNCGSASIVYSGSKIYEWTFTTSLQKTDRLNVVYGVVVNDD